MLKNLSDIELIELVRLGKVRAFEELYARYSESIYKSILIRVNSSFDADDILQTFFISIWEKKSDIKINTSVKSYLMSWLKHHILNTIREEQIRVRHQEEQSQWTEEDNNVIDLVIADDLNDRIREVVAGFPDRLKQIYKLSREEHLSVREISERESLSEQTVKNQISDILRRLRKEINKTNFIFF